MRLLVRTRHFEQTTFVLGSVEYDAVSPSGLSVISFGHIILYRRWARYESPLFDGLSRIGPTS